MVFDENQELSRENDVKICHDIDIEYLHSLSDFLNEWNSVEDDQTYQNL